MPQLLQAATSWQLGASGGWGLLPGRGLMQGYISPQAFVKCDGDHGADACQPIILFADPISPIRFASRSFFVRSDSASASVAECATAALASIRNDLEWFGFLSMMDGGDSEHELTAPLADRRRVFDRHIGNRLHPNSEAHRA
jgi:hypothetical protein